MTPEEISYELLAWPVKATLQKGLSGSTAKEMEKGIQVVGIESLREEQRNYAELRVIISWIQHPQSVPGSDELRTFSPEIQQLWAQRQSLHVREAI